MLEETVVETETTLEAADEKDTTVAEGEAKEEATENKAEGEDDKKPEEKPPEKVHPVQKRIDKLTRDKYMLKGELEAVKRENEALRNSNHQGQREEVKPVRESYNSDAEFIEALTDFKVNAAMAKIPPKEDFQTQPNSVAREAEARSLYEDYDEYVEDGGKVNLPEAAVVAIQRSPYRPDIQYMIGKNPEMAESWAKMHPLDIAKAIGKLELGIEGKSKPAPKAKVSNAPAPVKPLAPKGGSGKVDPYDPNTPIDVAMGILTKKK
jgi:hypothetical protein